MLIDRICKKDAIDNAYELDMPVIKEWLRTAYVLRCSNVAEYLIGHEKAHPETVHIHDEFPNVAPSFETMWFEWQDPRAVTQPDHPNYPGHSRPKHFGVLMNACDRATNPNAVVWGREMKGQEEVKWAVNAFAFQFTDDKKKAVYMSHCYWSINKDGTFGQHRSVSGEKPFLKFGSIGHGITVAPSETWIKALDKYAGGYDPEEYPPRMLRMLATPLMALCFLHCKNVVVEKSAPPTPKKIRSHRKKGKPVFRYHTIRVSPHVVSRTGARTGTHDSPAVHIMRGHFKKFTTEKPLFGKHTGVYWWPMNIRGNKKSGVVVKDYDVGPEKTPIV